VSNSYFEAGLAWPKELTAIHDEAVRGSVGLAPLRGTATACWFGTFRESWHEVSEEERADDRKWSEAVVDLRTWRCGRMTY
jgi:hypothetical protein